MQFTTPPCSGTTRRTGDVEYLLGSEFFLFHTDRMLYRPVGSSSLLNTAGSGRIPPIWSISRTPRKYARRSIAIYMPIGYNMYMKRTALFLKEDQLKKLQILSDKTGAPVAELIRRAIDKYLRERAKELK